MPSKSKQQQKFMGIVRAIQKGDEPASKFSKDAQDAADDMKKKDVEKFASTKHKGLPKKVEQALREKIRTMVEDYVESCGYVVSAKDPNYKLKSPGGTGEEDRELKDEGFGGELPKTEKKKFEKERLENAEVLGYTLTGTKDLKEAITGGDRKVLMVVGKEIRDNLLKKHPGLRGNERMLIQGIGATFSSMRFTPDNINYKNYKKYFPKRFNDKLVKRLGDRLAKEKDTVRKTFFKQVVKENESKKESVFAVRQDKIKNGERFSKKPNFNYDPEKGKSRIKKVNEAMNPRAVKKMRDEFEKTGQLPPHLKRFALDLKILKKKHKVKNIVVPGLEWMSDMKEQSVDEKKKMFPPKKMTPKQAKEYKKFIGYAKMGVEYQIDMSLFESINEARLDPKQAIQQLGGNRFLYMVGAKNLAIDKSRNELHMKIMRNAKGVSHVVVRLTSLDLYDMKFLQIRAGKIRVKAKEKGVYGDQLATFFKKHTGLNTRL